MTAIERTEEGRRLVEERAKTNPWRRWGSYVSERQWGTVREDYSAGGNAWDYFSHDQARSRAYRWGEDGLAGLCDERQRLCFALALWNGQDPILKERLFGLTNSEGNHGEDVKEYYFYLDNTPTHSYMKYLYKYPQNAFPYSDLVQENARRKANPGSFEYELIDTGIFHEDRYFDIFVEYAKNTPDDILIKITAINRGPEAKPLHLLPTLWFRNSWSWGYADQVKPSLKVSQAHDQFSVIEATHEDLGQRWLYCEAPDQLLFTENETNRERFSWGPNSTPYVKDGINNYVVAGAQGCVNPEQTGTKAAAHYHGTIDAGATVVVRLRLADQNNLTAPFGPDFDAMFQTRLQQADEFYQAVTPFTLSPEMRKVQRQAFAGMLWSKQFYYYMVHEWLNGDPAGPAPARQNERNTAWTHLYNEDILSMPDKWEYPWFAAWDLAFHTIALTLIDPDFAKSQLSLFAREWYMHPNGQLPAYEWAFDDVNPPVHAWATWRVYQIEKKMYGRADRSFLERVFQKLLLYFTWWVNRKDAAGNNLFEGGFLGLDNIGIFDRSHLDIPGATIEQSDGTAWMAMYCLNMLAIAIELAKENSAYVDIASKLFQHFLLIAEAMNNIGGGLDVWDASDNFYYDILKVPENALPGGNDPFPFVMKVRSMVGLIPMFAVETIRQGALDSYLASDFKPRFDWFLRCRQDLTDHGNIDLRYTRQHKAAGVSLALVDPQKLKFILKRMLDETEFLSPYGIRALSKAYDPNDPPYQPYCMPFALKTASGQIVQPSIEYEPAESRSGLFGGNSNWRGPIWFPVNFMIIESLQKFHYVLGDDFKVECPTGSGTLMTLWEVSMELSRRLISIFLPDASGKRPVYGGKTTMQNDPNWRDFTLFFEYFHGDCGAGLGASHQTGWTGVVAKLIQQTAEYAQKHP